MFINHIMQSGTITEVRLTSEGYEYLVMDDETGVEAWYAENDLTTLLEA